MLMGHPHRASSVCARIRVCACVQGCGRYRAGHAADHWKTANHCYALELESQRVRRVSVFERAALLCSALRSWHGCICVHAASGDKHVLGLCLHG